MWPISTTISSRKQHFTHINQMKSGLVRQWKLAPYAMHYWYFNVVDLDTRRNYSYILARSNAEVLLNGSLFAPKPDVYTSVCVDFSEQRVDIQEKIVKIERDTLCADDFQFGVQDNKTYLNFGTKQFAFERMLSDSYWANFLDIYAWYNLNASHKNAYLNVNNVIVRGPLIPWNWLHFYFEDGTYVKVFSAVGQKKTLRLNDDYFALDYIRDEPDTISYRATKGDTFFELTIRKGFRAALTYKPKFSPAWQYDQINTSLVSVKTNIEGFDVGQYGGGILELTKGFSW